MANADMLNKLLQALLLFIFCSEEVYLNIAASKAGGCSQLLRFVIGIRQARIIAFPLIWWHGQGQVMRTRLIFTILGGQLAKFGTWIQTWEQTFRK